jgi:hypothetical protein
MYGTGTVAQEKRAKDLAAMFADARKRGRYYDCCRTFGEALESRQIKPADFSFASLFDAFVLDGRELRQTFAPHQKDSYRTVGLESAVGAVSNSDFANITGQIIYSQMLEGFNLPQFIGDRLFRTVPSQFEREKVPRLGITYGDDDLTVQEREAFPYAGMSSFYVETPDTIKRGIILALTKEALFLDRTGQLLQQARDVGEHIGLNREKRMLDVALGLVDVYKPNGNTAEATYQSSGSRTNIKSSNALTDWTDVEAVELLFDDINDPVTGEPIDVMPNQLLVPKGLEKTANYVVNRTTTWQNAKSRGSGVEEANYAQPLTPYEVLSSPYVKNKQGNQTTWYVGEFPRAFAYIENWGLTVEQAPAQSHDEFTRDVVTQFKASERGAAAAMEPRRVAKSTA